MDMDNSETAPATPSSLWRVIKMMTGSLLAAAVAAIVIPVCVWLSKQTDEINDGFLLGFIVVWATLTALIWPLITTWLVWSVMEEDREAHDLLLEAAKKSVEDARLEHANTRAERDEALARSIPEEWFAKAVFSSSSEPYKLSPPKADFNLVIFDRLNRLNGPKKAKIVQVNVPYRDTVIAISIEGGLRLVMDHLSSGHFSLSGEDASPYDMEIFHHLADDHTFSLGPLEIIVCTDLVRAVQVITLLQAELKKP